MPGRCNPFTFPARLFSVMYGRDEVAWEPLTEAGTTFLIERAHLRKTTSYTELNATLERRIGLPGFDFTRAD